VWIETARTIVRTQFAARPEVRYLEVDIESDAGAPEKLAAFVGATKSVSVPRANARTVRTENTARTAGGGNAGAGNDGNNT
jgi:hypothetical protein